jgi:bifunctional DNA-binding transcriptional regulator/antitoxin component of YhaV-PrlF toxin-antitoxin module
MPLVKVRTKYQVTLPNAVREQVPVAVGDVLEAKVERGKITLIPKSVVDRAIAEGLEDLRKGRTYGPYHSANEAIAALHRMARKRARKPRNA